MKTLIYQVYYEGTHTKPDHNTGCYLTHANIAMESRKRFEIYAESIGADYKFISEPVFENIKNAGWQRFAMLDLASDYDQMCYIDADICPSKECLGISIFDWEGVGKKTERDEGTRAEWHVNAGVFKVTKREAMKLRNEIHKKPYVRWLEKTGKNQDPFNKAWYKAMGRRPGFLDPRWNCTRPHHNPRWFAHYIGHQKARGNQWGYYKNCPVWREEW